MTPARRAARDKAHRRAIELSGMKILARMDPDDGLLSWRSSPHVMWLGAVLAGSV
jgi:hypothetical protein